LNPGELATLDLAENIFLQKAFYGGMQVKPHLLRAELFVVGLLDDLAEARKQDVHKFSSH
jgi:hypothetical protein